MQARTNNNQLTSLIADDVPPVILEDVDRLRQVLLNLLSNALKFTTSGHVRVDVSSRGRIGDRFDLVFAIQDDGIGIPQERLKDIFSAFSQVDASISRKYGGTGLGLAICQRLVRLMGGDIWVDSTFGKGSTFYFNIPTVEYHAVAEEEGVEREVSGESISNSEVSSPRKRSREVDEETYVDWLYILVIYCLFVAILISFLIGCVSL